MDILIAGGTGFIGQALVKHYLAQSARVTVLGRSKSKIKHYFPKHVASLDWDAFNRAGLGICQQQDVIINLCGETIGAKRWTDKRKQAIISSRVQTSQAIAKVCAQLGTQSPRWLNASAVGIYGLQSHLEHAHAFTEFDSLTTESSDFLSKVAHLWEASTLEAEAAGVNVVKLRFGVVLAKHGGALTQIARPFKFGLGGTIGTGKQPFAWITLTDLIRAFDFIVYRPEISGIINLVAPGCIQQAEFAQALAAALHRPNLFHTPGWLLTLLFGQMAKELLLYGQHAKPKRLLELGFKFQYPDIHTALRAIFK